MQNDNQQPQGFGTFLKGWFKQLWHCLTHPWMLLPTILISAAWIALGILHTRLGETKAIAILNFFTFAQGGLFGGTAGAIGGILGKLLIATLLNALILPLFSRDAKPFARFGKGFKGLFGSFAFDSLRALSVFLFGLAIALAVYSFFNITQRWQESLVGVVAAVLLIRNIGQRGGLLFSLLSSMVSALTKGHSPSYVGVTRFLSGMIIGFTLGTGLNAFGLRCCVLVAAGCFLVALIFVLFGKKQRAAFAAVSIAAMLMIPLHAESPSASFSTEQQSQADLKAASKKYATELQPYVDEINRCIAVVQSQNENTPQAEQDAAQRQLEAAQKKFYDVLNHFAKYGTSGEKPQEKKKEERIQLEKQDMGSISTETITVIGDGTGNPFADSPDGDFPSGSNPDPVGTETGTEGINDWKPEGEESILTKIGLDEATSEQIEKIATEGWADEDSRVEEEEDVTLLEGIAAGAAVAGAAGAAGAAGGGAGGGGGLPDFPEGDWDATDPQRRDEEDGEDGEDDPSGGDGGDGPDPYDPYEGSKVPQNANVRENGDGTITMKSPSTGEQITLVPDGNGGWENPLSGVQYNNDDVAGWIQDQQENKKYWEDVAKTNAAYKEAFEKDAAEYASHSEEARLDEEVARENARELLEKGYTPEKCNDIRVTAMRYGIPVDDEEGNPRDIELVQKDTENWIRSIQKLENARQADYAAEELEASLLLADAQFMDTAAEVTLDVGATVTGPLGKGIRDAHNLAKATLVGGYEAYLDGRDVVTGLSAGLAEGELICVQKHMGDLMTAGGATGATKIVGTGVFVVAIEGGKVALHEIVRGSDDTVGKMQEAIVKKGIEQTLLAGLNAIGPKIKDDYKTNFDGSSFTEAERAILGTRGTVTRIIKTAETTTKTIPKAINDKISEIRDEYIYGIK